jgi:hypothetical protein
VTSLAALNQLAAITERTSKVDTYEVVISTFYKIAAIVA